MKSKAKHKKNIKSTFSLNLQIDTNKLYMYIENSYKADRTEKFSTGSSFSVFIVEISC